MCFTPYCCTLCIINLRCVWISECSELLLVLFIQITDNLSTIIEQCIVILSDCIEWHRKQWIIMLDFKSNIEYKIYSKT